MISLYVVIFYFHLAFKLLSKKLIRIITKLFEHIKTFLSNSFANRYVFFRKTKGIRMINVKTFVPALLQSNS